MIPASTLQRLSLRAAICTPILYFTAVLLAACFYPGFSFTRQFASELGMDGTPHPWILNSGIILVGLACISSTFGFYGALTDMRARPMPTRWFTAFIGCFGFAIVMAGVFPHPDWRHSGFGLSFPIAAAPALLAAALWDNQRHALLRRYLLINNALMILLILLFVSATRSRVVGLFQLLYSLAAIPWIGVAAHALSLPGRASHTGSGLSSGAFSSCAAHR